MYVHELYFEVYRTYKKYVRKGWKKYHPGGEYSARLQIRIRIRPDRTGNIFTELEIPDTTDCCTTEYTR